MKTQNFGRTDLPSFPSTSTFRLPFLGRIPLALKHYRRSRENGTEQDNPKNPFPSAGFDALEIQESDWKSYDDWPDKQGRYWWKLELNDRRIVEDFYWTKDDVRGFPDKNDKDRFWFIVHHKNGTRIEGFSLEPNREKGFPDNDKKYWRYIHYIECGPIKAWMEEKDKNYLARLGREVKAKQPEVAQYLLTLDVDDSQRFSHIKSQNFGRAEFDYILKTRYPYSKNILHHLVFPMRFRCDLSLKNYRENRENGTEQDNPKNPFPSAGFDALDIRKSGWKSYNDWPDIEGRYWWTFTLYGGRVVEDFYWTKDEVRGFPDKNNRDRCWFIVHHKNGTQIEGFSLEPNHEKGFPDEDKNYWRYIQYTECGPIKTWMEEKDKNYLARLEREKALQHLEDARRQKEQHQIQLQLQLLNWQSIQEESPHRPMSHVTLDSLGQAYVDAILSYEDLKFGKLLGKGGFGAVYEGDWQGVPIAIKKLFEKHVTAEQEAEFRHEAGMMVQLRHPHIVIMYGITLKPENCMVLELMVKGALYSVLHSDEPMSWQLRYNIGLDAAKGLAYLHDKHILHRDLKSLNVLLDKDYRAKLADFGLSKIKATSTLAQQAGLAGTLQWIAPELFLDTSAQYTPACDVYSFAMILWELMSREQPYRNISVPGLIPIHVIKGNRETIPQEAPRVLQQTTQQGWVQAPEKRPNMREVVKVLTDNPVTDNKPQASPHQSKSASTAQTTFFTRDNNNRYSSGESKSDSPSTSSGYIANIASEEPQKSKAIKANADSGYLHQSYQMPSSSSSNSSYFSTHPSLPLPEIEDDVTLEARATHSYRAKEMNQLSFTKGAILQVIEQNNTGWWLCELDGQQGLVPSNHIHLIDDMISEINMKNTHGI